jgi:hypothetical protein
MMAKISNRTEPFIQTTHELDSGELSFLLSWYSAHCQPADFQKFFKEYLTSLNKEYTDEGVESFLRFSPTVGCVCRIISRGGRIPAASLRWLDHKIAEFSTFVPPKPLSGNDRPKPEKKKTVVVDKTSQCIGELEECLDTMILSNFKDMIPPISVMRTHEITGPQATQIINHFKRFRDEYTLAAKTKDPDIKEAYSNFTKPQLNKLAGYCDRMMSDGLTIIQESMKRPARKRVAKTTPKKRKAVK